jgi:hypothetical protein
MYILKPSHQNLNLLSCTKKSTKDRAGNFFFIYLVHLVYASINHDSARLINWQEWEATKARLQPKANEG